MLAGFIGHMRSEQLGQGQMQRFYPVASAPAMVVANGVCQS